ncbi:hypothetical protein, partial [Paracraurococcus lichenis]
LEFDALRVLELDGSVDDYIEQPLLLRYEMDGKLRFAKPDILLLRGGKLFCCEVKFEDDARQAESKWLAIGRALSSLGLGYSVLTERHIRRGPLFQNVKTVFARRHCRPSRTAALNALTAVRAAGALTITDLGSRFGITFDEACFLLRYGLLSADLVAARLGPNTEVRWSRRCRVDPWQARK